ncbi:MAG: DUF4167 domain-containing protein [Pseudomonadota bacterium]
MRHGSNSRRSRGRNMGGGNNNGNRKFNPKMHSYDSNGPEVRIRGNAYQIVEKYVTLARDASSAGDNVLAESYYQFAEHYQRIINEFTASVDRTDSANSDDNNNAKSADKNDRQQQPRAEKQPQPRHEEPQNPKAENIKMVEDDKAPAPKAKESEGEKKPTRKRAVREKKSETVDA